MLWSIAVIGLLFVLVLVLTVRTALFTKKAAPPQPPKEAEGIDPEEVAAHLAGAVRIPTVSNADPNQVDWTQFQKFHDYLRATYPLIHQTMEWEQIAGYNLIYRWPGRDQNAKPIAFLSHQDVVPAADLSQWTYPPFSGYDDGESIWGRGTLDMKNQLIVVMEACERLIAQGYTPREDVYLCFGQNEEVGDLPAGTGADAIAALLQQRGIRFDCVLDEGGTIADGKAMGVDGKVCIVGVAEKGFATYRLEAQSKGGHSSRPPLHTALGKVCRAAAQVEAHPMKPRLIAPVREMFRSIAPYMKAYTLRLMVANLWLFEPLFLKIIGRIPMIGAMVSTTSAVTQAQGSQQDNILPQHAYVAVNCRILPGQTVEEVRQHLQGVIDDPDVTVSVYKSHQVQEISRLDSRAMQTIARLSDRYYPGTVTTPYVMFGGSDARNYYAISDCVYRYMPFYFEIEGQNIGIHQANEHIPKRSLARAVAIFMDFIKEYEGEDHNG